MRVDALRAREVLDATRADGVGSAASLGFSGAANRGGGTTRAVSRGGGVREDDVARGGVVRARERAAEGAARLTRHVLMTRTVLVRSLRVGSGDERGARVERARLVRAGAGAVGGLPVSEGGRAAPAAAGAEAHVRARPRGVVAVGGVRGEDECVDGSPVRARVEANRGELGEAARYRSRARVVVEDVVRPGRAHRGHPPGRRAHGDDPALLVRALELAQERALIMEHRVQQPRAAEIWREGMAGESAALDAHRSRDEGARDASSAAPTRARVCVPTRSFSGTQLNGMHISREMVLQAGEEVPCMIAQLNVIGVI